MIDHGRLDLPPRRFEFQPKLLFERLIDGRPDTGVASDRADVVSRLRQHSKRQDQRVCSLETGRVDHWPVYLRRQDIREILHNLPTVLNPAASIPEPKTR